MFHGLSLRTALFSMSRLTGLAIIVVVGVAAFAGATLVAAQRGGSGEPPAAASYQGCVNTYTGVLRIIDAGQQCQDHEMPISLSGSAGDAALLERIETLEADNEALETRLAALEGRVSTCMTTEEVDGQEHPDVVFEGCNIHVRNGSAATDGETNGLGNLIIGYNESNGDTRTGSHNLVIGPHHSYSSYGGLVSGADNSITGPFSSVTGGATNTASGYASSVSGGEDNMTIGDYSSVSGGFANFASGFHSSVSAGELNIARGDYSSVSGGFVNNATGDVSSVSGGHANTASGDVSSVSGGFGNTASANHSSVSGGESNTASGEYSSVGGGFDLDASGSHEFEPLTP